MGTVVRDRRGFMAVGGLAVAGTLLGAVAGRALASEHEGEHQAGHHGPGAARGVRAVVIDASREGVCATCAFWGGVRRVAEDRKTVHCESLGWCNNPESQHYQMMTTPETGPMKSWKRFQVL